MPIPDPQIDDHILSISCAVVARPDHNCGDDLVLMSAECCVITARSKRHCSFSQSSATGPDVRPDQTNIQMTPSSTGSPSASQVVAPLDEVTASRVAIVMLSS